MSVALAGRDSGCWAGRSRRRSARRRGCRAASRMSARVRLSAVAVSASRGTSRIFVEQRPQLAVIGAEIVPPFADAMRFVDGDQRQVHAADQPPERLAASRARARHRADRARRLEPLDGPLAVRVGRGQRCRANADRVRRCGSGRASARSAARSPAPCLTRQRRQLVAQRLARAGRHHRRACAVPASTRSTTCFLDAAEVIEAEDLLEDRVGVGHELCCWSGPAAAMQAVAPAVRPG